MDVRQGVTKCLIKGGFLYTLKFSHHTQVLLSKAVIEHINSTAPPFFLTHRARYKSPARRQNKPFY